MKKTDYFSDSLGRFALNAMSTLVGQLTYFYTDKIGLAAGAVAAVFLLVKIADAFTGVIMGYVVDHTGAGREKYRPWMVRMAVPAAAFCVLLFLLPAHISEAGKIAYMMVTNLLFTSVIFTAIDIPYNSLQVVRTESQEERSNMGIWRAASGYASGMMVVLSIIPVTNLLGGTQSSWVRYGACVGLIVLLMLLVCWKRSKEIPEAQQREEKVPEEEPVPLLTSLKLLLQNKYWIMTTIMGLVSQVYFGLSGSSAAYYAKWIFGDDNLTAVLGGIGMIPTLLGFGLTNLMIRKFGTTGTLKLSFLIGAAANLLRIFHPAHFAWNVVWMCFSLFANIPMMCLLGVLTAMVIDYNEYKYGKRMVATSQSMSGFGGKVGAGIGASVIGWCLAAASYDGMATTATPTVRQAIFTFTIYIPFAIYVILFILICRFDLEKKIPEYRKEIELRKKQEQGV